MEQAEQQLSLTPGSKLHSDIFSSLIQLVQVTWKLYLKAQPNGKTALNQPLERNIVFKKIQPKVVNDMLKSATTSWFWFR